MFKPIFAFVAATMLSGCADTHVTRNEIANGPATLLSFGDIVQQQNLVSQQADALHDLSQDIVRASTIKGVKVGAAVGCGLALVSASSAQKCVAGAVVGGLVGGVAGNTSGKRQVAKRVELVNPNQLVRSISKTNDSMQTLSNSLPQLLSVQEKELETIRFQRDMGTLAQVDYEKRYLQIKANRAAIAQSLSLSTQQANLAGKNLENAATQGQTGLEWHFGATNSIAKQAESARSSIKLL